jgi:hypothetical protein
MYEKIARDNTPHQGDFIAAIIQPTRKISTAISRIRGVQRNGDKISD